LLSAAALLGEDMATAEAATAIADQRLRLLAGTQAIADLATHRRSLLAGGAARVDPDLLPENLDPRDPLAASSLFLLCREAIDAGAGTLAVETARLQARQWPPGRAVLAAIEAAATSDEDLWHEALAIAVGHGLRLVGVDALEGLAVSAAASEAWAECLRLASAAMRLRNETGYRYRFHSEQQRLEVAVAAATEALGSEATSEAAAEGADLSFDDAAAYAARARGVRKRPSHGWAALTPTEEQVVALVAEGLTNPQIAERLLMGRATVKTHLDHVFAKTGLRSRTELAAEYVRRGLT
jgi:DNA-binding CsgD family transcriptional regulator